jgi:hypothetical protein
MFGTEFNEKTNNGEYPYYGAIGGGLEYIFTPTGLGDCLVVREHFTKEEINVTDYDNW